eukprot:765149-Hanusia_phi.AAC.5
MQVRARRQGEEVEEEEVEEEEAEEEEVEEDEVEEEAEEEARASSEPLFSFVTCSWGLWTSLLQVRPSVKEEGSDKSTSDLEQKPPAALSVEAGDSPYTALASLNAHRRCLEAQVHRQLA